MPSHDKKFNLDIMDDSPVACCVTEVVRNEEGQPVDWIYRYCNEAFADIKEYRTETLLDHANSSISPRTDAKWLRAYYEAAYEEKSCEFDLEMEGDYHAFILPIGRRGFCACVIRSRDRDDAAFSGDPSPERRKRWIMDKLAPEYVSIYRIEANSGKYEILRLVANTNARKLVTDHPALYATFDEYSVQYAKAFILPEDRPEFLDWLSCANMKERLLHSEKITYHYHSVSRDGHHSFYEAYAVKGQNDAEHFDIFLGFRNIDSILYKERQIQEELQKALDEARLGNEIIASIARTYQYISRIDLAGDHFDEVANKDHKLLSYPKSGSFMEENRKTCRENIAEEYQEAFLKFLDLKTLPERMGKEDSIALEYRMRDGSWHKMRLIEKKRDANGRLTHVLCAIRTISDAKKKEQDLLYQVAEAKKETALKTRFLSNMSHDIRTPLNGIMGMIELADRYPEDPAVQKKCREQMMKSSRYLVALVSDILAMSKLEAGDTDIQDIPFDLTELLNRANLEKQRLAAEKQIHYDVLWERGEILHTKLIGNPAYAERILLAVADNAVKFTNPGGTVCVWCRETPMEDGRSVYEFCCADNGIGIGPDFLPHAFDLFAQENETSRTQYEGAGLGLSIAQKLTGKLGGTIEIKSEKGKGTTVSVRIPFRMDPSREQEGAIAGAALQSGERGEPCLEGMHALLAEDNELNTEIARFLLESHGMTVDCVADGEEAVERFAGSAPGDYDVIFMDIMMPKMNGWDAARRIRAMNRPDAADIPIIAMSANTFAEDIVNSHIAGMNAHLSKPLEDEQILGALQKCLKKKAGQNGTA